MSDRQPPNALVHVQRGMQVYDANGDEIGVVEHVYLGSNANPDLNENSGDMPNQDDGVEFEGKNVIVDAAFPEILNPEKLPTELVERMLKEGYFQVARPALEEIGTIILPDQIDSVSEEGIHLIP